MPRKKTLLTAPRSYISLLYGALTVVILFVILYFGLSVIYQKHGTLGEDGLQTSENIQKTYVVKQGDSLWTIAEAQYQDGYQWVGIATANKLTNPDTIHAGNRLIIPLAAAKVQEQVAAEQKITGGSYTVVQGDNLWNIAVRAYGDGFKWVEIARANNLANPNLIHSGNIFTLPR